MTRLFVFGLGYAARAIAMRAGGVVMATTRDGRDGTIRFDDDAAVRAGVAPVPREEGTEEASDEARTTMGGGRRSVLHASSS